ncbi:hypothetical protein ABIA52_004147 [Paenarthrobacter histidinolovorans]|uniref:Uncharacterized protein n=1 Tax=Paenarthrobacter histidinolovorans TaxID=43664 RepID=A0ABW8NCQ3_9MICC
MQLALQGESHLVLRLVCWHRINPMTVPTNKYWMVAVVYHYRMRQDSNYPPSSPTQPDAQVACLLLAGNTIRTPLERSPTCNPAVTTTEQLLLASRLKAVLM